MDAKITMDTTKLRDYLYGYYHAKGLFLSF